MPTEKAWYVYLLLCADNSLYCGISTDLQRRLAEHNGLDKYGKPSLKHKGAKYTRIRRPVHLCAKAICANKSQALKLEYYVKSLPKAKKIAYLQGYSQELNF